MKDKLKGMGEFATWEQDDDVVALLERMRSLVHGEDETEYEYWRMQTTMRSLLEIKQFVHESPMDFYERFMAQVKVTEDSWGKLSPMILKGKLTSEQDEGRNKFLACMYLGSTDKVKYKEVIDSLNNNFVQGQASYPKDVPSMVSLLNNWRGDLDQVKAPVRREVDMNSNRGGTSFATLGGEEEEEEREEYCSYCGSTEHVWAQCDYRAWDEQYAQNNECNDDGGSDQVNSWNM